MIFQAIGMEMCINRLRAIADFIVYALIKHRSGVKSSLEMKVWNKAYDEWKINKERKKWKRSEGMNERGKKEHVLWYEMKTGIFKSECVPVVRDCNINDEMHE